MRIYILRHGVTPWNRLRKAQGCMDIPLAEDGIRLAKKTGEALKDVPFDICFSSPLIRAQDTARYVLNGREIPFILDNRIQEINFGVLEGEIMMDEGGEVRKEFSGFFTDPSQFIRPQDGESIEDVLARTRDFWMEKTTHPKLCDKTILVSTHGCAARALLQNIYHDPENFWHGCVPPNCCINLAEVKDGKARLLEEDKVYY